MQSSINDFIAGCAGGIAQVLVGQPFDLVKVRLQIANSNQNTYNGVFDCLRKIIKYEGGTFGLWKGTLPPLLGVGGAVSIQFGVNEKTKLLAKEITGLSSLKMSHLFFCGMLAGIANSIVSIPVEHTRIRMQIQGKKSPSACETFRKIYRGHGLRGVYKGGFPTLWRESIALGIYFSMYEWITKNLFLNATKQSLNVAEVVCAGGLAGISLWFVTFPIDMIKSKIQTDSFQNPTYNGMWDCLRKTYRTGGLLGFYKGLTPCLLRAVPANGVTFLVYETASKLLKSKEDLVQEFGFI